MRYFRLFSAPILNSLAIIFFAHNAANCDDIMVQPDRSDKYVGDFPETRENPDIEAYKQSHKELQKREAGAFLQRSERRALEANDFESCIMALSAAIQAQPENANYRKDLCEAHIKYGDYLLAKGAREKAVQEFRNAISVDHSCEAASKRLEEITESKMKVLSPSVKK